MHAEDAQNGDLPKSGIQKRQRYRRDESLNTHLEPIPPRVSQEGDQVLSGSWPGGQRPKSGVDHLGPSCRWTGAGCRGPLPPTSLGIPESTDSRRSTGRVRVVMPAGTVWIARSECGEAGRGPSMVRVGSRKRCRGPRAALHARRPATTHLPHSAGCDGLWDGEYGIAGDNSSWGPAAPTRGHGLGPSRGIGSGRLDPIPRGGAWRFRYAGEGADQKRESYASTGTLLDGGSPVKHYLDQPDPGGIERVSSVHWTGGTRWPGPRGAPGSSVQARVGRWSIAK